MAKHFKNFPPEFEKYNPEVFDLAQNELKTFDLEGSLHSHNDKPSLIMRQNNVVRSATWHSHGQVFREGGRPSQILFANNRYESRNESFNIHSDGDLPAMITYDADFEEFWLEWHKEGHSHRENGLPDMIISSPKGNSFFYHVNGFRHRDGDLPAYITPDEKQWFFLNRLHNSSGPAVVEAGRPFKWYLFGVQIREETFNAIHAYRKSTEVPLWVAFLVKMNMTSVEAVESLFNNSGKWESFLPNSWVLRWLKVTSKSMMLAKNDMEEDKGPFMKTPPIKLAMDQRMSTVAYPNQEKSDFSDFMKIGLFLDKNMSFEEEQKLKAKPSYEF